MSRRDVEEGKVEAGKAEFQSTGRAIMGGREWRGGRAGAGGRGRARGRAGRNGQAGGGQSKDGDGETTDHDARSFNICGSPGVLELHALENCRNG